MAKRLDNKEKRARRDIRDENRQAKYYNLENHSSNQKARDDFHRPAYQTVRRKG